MSHDPDFYVGYLDESPSNVSRFIKRIVIGLFVLIPIIGFLGSKFQSNYSSGKFEFGKLTTLDGVILSKPVPMLKIFDGVAVDGERIYQNIPLVSYGKFGADGVVDKFENRVKDETGKPLKDVSVTLRGTLAYYDGKTIFELSKKEKSLINIRVPETVDPIAMIEPISKGIGRATLKGEIIDPKCYFGAMNPGRGKSHRSCAIMCIRGGIPPILAVESSEGQNAYYFLMSENGDRINNDVLKYVGEPLQITGAVASFDDWYIMTIDPFSAIKRIAN